jgi:hypothetical protein
LIGLTQIPGAYKATAQVLQRPPRSNGDGQRERKDVMSKTNCKSMNCLIYRRLAEIQQSPADRQSAMYAMRDAEAIAEAVIRVKDWIASLGALILNPVFKH